MLLKINGVNLIQAMRLHATQAKAKGHAVALLLLGAVMCLHFQKKCGQSINDYSLGMVRPFPCERMV